MKVKTSCDINKNRGESFSNKLYFDCDCSFIKRLVIYSCVAMFHFLASNCRYKMGPTLDLVELIIFVLVLVENALE